MSFFFLFLLFSLSVCVSFFLSFSLSFFYSSFIVINNKIKTIGIYNIVRCDSCGMTSSQPWENAGENHIPWITVYYQNSAFSEIRNCQLQTLCLGKQIRGRITPCDQTNNLRSKSAELLFAQTDNCHLELLLMWPQTCGSKSQKWLATFESDLKIFPILLLRHNSSNVFIWCGSRNRLY